MSNGKQLVDEGVVPTEKREKFNFDLENIPEDWDSVVKLADETEEKYDQVNYCNIIISIL